MKEKAIIGGVFLVIIISIIGIVMAQVAPEQFYGNVTINGSAAPDGTPVSAWINGVEKTTQTTVNGEYGTEAAGGFYVYGKSGDVIVFKIFGSEVGTDTLNSGLGTEKDLALTDIDVNEYAQPDNLPTYTNTTFVLINWTTNPGSDTSGIDHYELLRAPSAIGPFVTINVTSDKTQTAYNDTSLSDGTYYYRLRTWDVVGNVKNATTDVNTTVDITAPSVTANTPIDQYVNNGTTLILNASITDALSGVKNATVDVSTVNSTIGTAILNNVSGYWINDTVIVGTATEGLHNLTITAYDNATNVNNTINLTVIVDNTQPSVTAITPINLPVNNGTTLHLNASITDAGSGIKNATVNVSRVNSTIGIAELINNSGFWTNDSIIVAAPIEGLQNLTITAYDNATNINSTINLTVIVDNTPPTVTPVSPTGTGVALSTTISATFNETMNTTSVENAFSISGGSYSLGSFVWTADNKTFTRSASLSYSTTYTVTISTAAKDLAGNSLASYTWSFTTETAPVVYYPGGGAAPAAPAGETSVSTEPTGEVKSTVTAPSADGKASVTIPAGIIARDAANNPLTKITVTQPSALPTVPSGVDFVGYAYDFGPTGATFSKPVEISITFDPTKFEGRTPVIYVYEAGTWKALDTTVVGNKATAKVTHFSTFVLFAVEKVEVTPTPTPTPTPPPTVTPTPTPTPPVAPPVKLPCPLIIGIIIAVIVIIGAVAYIYTKKKT